MQQDASLYTAALQRGRTIMAKNWQPATNLQRDKIWQELEEWSQQQLGKPAVQCTPLDLVVYLESSYIRCHGRQQADNGSNCPAPNTVACAVAHLSTKFQELGCRGVWDWNAFTGNPCSSMEIRTFKGGYANQMQDLGYKPTAAKPISSSKLQQLVMQLEEEADAYQQLPKQQQQPWYIEALLRRDACIAQYLWDSKRRPAEAGQLQNEQVNIDLSASCGASMVSIQPSVSKMCHASRGSRQPRPVQVQGTPGGRLAELFMAYMQCVQQQGKTLGRYMFSPLQADKQDFKTQQGLSTAAMGSRLVMHLKRLGLYEGESLYSIKRGAMQNEFFVNGCSMQAIGEAADIDTPTVVQMYLDPERHL
eukprot:GHUV01003634.1.p2 GENE.GHUV01003634.1~~GHUV01003634.1.p2  ORF type:complete len:408 (-),score=155.96 GHUV01003634.1:5007-6095(-)